MGISASRDESPKIQTEDNKQNQCSDDKKYEVHQTETPAYNADRNGTDEQKHWHRSSLVPRLVSGGAAGRSTELDTGVVSARISGKDKRRHDVSVQISNENDGVSPQDESGSRESGSSKRRTQLLNLKLLSRTRRSESKEVESPQASDEPKMSKRHHKSKKNPCNRNKAAPTSPTPPLSPQISQMWCWGDSRCHEPLTPNSGRSTIPSQLDSPPNVISDDRFPFVSSGPDDSTTSNNANGRLAYLAANGPYVYRENVTDRLRASDQAAQVLQFTSAPLKGISGTQVAPSSAYYQPSGATPFTSTPANQVAQNYRDADSIRNFSSQAGQEHARLGCPRNEPCQPATTELPSVTAATTPGLQSHYGSLSASPPLKPMGSFGIELPQAVYSSLPENRIYPFPGSIYQYSNNVYSGDKSNTPLVGGLIRQEYITSQNSDGVSASPKAYQADMKFSQAPFTACSQSFVSTRPLGAQESPHLMPRLPIPCSVQTPKFCPRDAVITQPLYVTQSKEGNLSGKTPVAENKGRYCEVSPLRGTDDVRQKVGSPQSPLSSLDRKARGDSLSRLQASDSKLRYSNRNLADKSPTTSQVASIVDVPSPSSRVSDFSPCPNRTSLSRQMTQLSRSRASLEEDRFAPERLKSESYVIGRKRSNTPAANSLQGLRGLDNLGNSCYLNCAVQCLAATGPLVDYFINDEHLPELNSKEVNLDGTGGKLTLELADVFKMLWVLPQKRAPGQCSHPIINNRGVSTRNLKKELDHAASQFKGHDQHDSQELLATLLDKIHEDINRVRGSKPYIVEPDISMEELRRKTDELFAAEAWERYLKRNRSFLVDLFQGQLQSATKCRMCGETSIKYDPFMYLTLPTMNPQTGRAVETLLEAVEAFTTPELLSDNDCWFCPRCRALCPAMKDIIVWKMPPVLIIHLKKFQFANGVFKKLEAKISISPGPPWKLEFPVGSEQKDPPTYRLYAVINHSGRYQNGHYSAICFHPFTQKWYLFDDDVVSEIINPDRNVISASNYVLFFERVKDDRDIAPIVRRQTLRCPEFWPHLLSSRRIAEFRASTGGLTDYDAILRNKNSSRMQLDSPSGVESNPMERSSSILDDTGEVEMSDYIYDFSPSGNKSKIKPVVRRHRSSTKPDLGPR